MSMYFDSKIGLPLHSVSAMAISSRRARMRSPMFHTMRWRSSGVMPAHAFERNASLATATARSTSALPACAQVVSGSPVAGLVMVNVAPSAASWYSPPIHRRPGRTSGTALVAVVVSADMSRSLVVFVDALAGLAAQAARLDVLHHEVVRAIALAQRLVQDGEDRQPRVESDQVDELERAHRMVEAQLERLVDVARAGHALLEHAERLVADERVHPRGDETGRLAHDHRLLAHAHADHAHRLDRPVAGLERAHHFEQLHAVDRVEEVHADDAVGPLGRARHLGDRQ